MSRGLVCWTLRVWSPFFFHLAPRNVTHGDFGVNPPSCRRRSPASMAEPPEAPWRQVDGHGKGNWSQYTDEMDTEWSIHPDCNHPFYRDVWPRLRPFVSNK